ncbi:phosphopyruvate hydratase [Candidatus Methylacidiphilum fumarolicum]|uniref:Enolase n=2 Tax=Candidatus Methylacidiphilum fumarolicum TaxID=591154 RepID=I0JXX4_METFB|nr:phosphopyruvate hydratase [Candidatus Methylacidiphilum fumarolicum]MBW6414166.1 phosphopyruvate hydratase [Candidatus Methylacidiphilum fumarolicum]TFE69998.1 phosphopyruvate hydratase [Candidatus Methylacidiphilum fumarolicum]TFE73803.1 phosphopyruvate hydratase [Candidatus Methylacidiphilum fumarolicum]TFE75591.1 phosphopyruvate hydratase [Candidatus Methylacidiphilum fumarolicum]TFE76756.1 phosphopyruvate hydratase [Candidatus Methylacidiphilum fumarolicum]
MANTFIRKVLARQVLDSRGNPTVEAEIHLESGIKARAIVPSGASTGSNEALELRDGNKERYGGKEVSKAIRNITKTIAPELIGKDAANQAEIDRILIDLDGSKNKSVLGANAILAVSLCVARAAAMAEGIPLYRHLGGSQAITLPIPFANVINGGVHSDAPLDFQEFMIVPKGAPSFKEGLRYGVEIFHTLKTLLQDKKLGTGIGDEGGFAPVISSADQAFDLLIEATERAGYIPGKDVFYAMDAAATELFEESSKIYVFKKSQHIKLPASHLIELYRELAKKYPLVSIEDGMAESDWDGWKQLTQQLGTSLQLVGDDLFVTNKEFLEQGIKEKVANAILIKVNQVGTLTETFHTVETAKRHGYKVMVSHRSGESEDPFIADLSVALNAGQIKTGSFCRSDRLCKYNQLLRIEEELGESAIYGI